MTRFVPPPRPSMLVALALGALIILMLALLPGGSAHAQALPTITVEAVERPGKPDVPVGAKIVFRVNRSGDLSGDFTVSMETLNTLGQVSFTSWPSQIAHQVHFAPGVEHVDVTVEAQEGHGTAGEMRAQVASGAAYQLGPTDSNRATFDLRYPTDSDIIVSIQPASSSTAEGEDAVFTVSRTGSTDSSLGVRVTVEDPDGAMRGNHWDPALQTNDYRKDVTFAAGSSTATASFPTRPNVRDTGDLTITASVVEDAGLNFWVGYPIQADVAVTDDDTAMEVSLSVDRENIIEGEDLTFTLTRHGDTSEVLEDPYFHVRIGPNYTRRLWPTNDMPQDYGVTMAADQRTVEWSLKVHYDFLDRNFRYEAEVRPARGIPWANRFEYVSVRGESKISANVANRARQYVTFSTFGGEVVPENPRQELLTTRFYEGQVVPYELVRSGPAEQIARELQVRIRYREIDHPYRVTVLNRPYYNPSEQIVVITFPAGETRATGSFNISVDDVDEGSATDRFEVYFQRPPSPSYTTRLTARGNGMFGHISDSPRAVSIARVAEESTIVEGEAAVFTLTRHGPTEGELTVSVSIDDPGHFRRGNHWNNTPDATVPVTFADGEDKATLTAPTSDDWRDIPDNTLTATVLPSQDPGVYRVAVASEGAASASFEITDNDVAPKIELRVSAATVEEGQEAYFDIVRTLDSRNYLEFPLLLGLQGEQKFRLWTLGPGDDLGRSSLRTEDDDYDGPDETVYELTLLPLEGIPEDERSQYRRVIGPSSITITVTDNDLPLVGVEPVQESYPEDRHGQFRIVREGQTDSALDVKTRLTQTENSYFEAYQYLLNVERTLTIDASRDSETELLQLQWDDGDEPEGSMTMQLLPDDGYRIDPERSIASFRVIDNDPTPTLAVSSVTMPEDGGIFKFKVSLSSSVSPPSLQTVTVDYVTEAGTAEAGEDYTHVAGTLTLGPEKTGGVIVVEVLDNELVEETESFTLVLSDPVNADLQDGQAKLTAVGTIEDNEPHVSVAAVFAEVDEGSPMLFRFTRSGNHIDLREPLTVHFGAGVRGVPSPWRQVVIPAGVNSATWEKPTEDNDYNDPDLNFEARVVPATWRGLPLYYGIDGGSASVTVRDNDLPVVTLEAVREDYTEGDRVEFTLTREGQLDQPLTVNVGVTQTNTSKEEADFLLGDPPATVTFAADSATATLSLPTASDSNPEPHGTISAAVESSADYRTGDPQNASVRIADNDREYTTSISVTAQSHVIEEGEDAVFVLTRTGGTNLDLVARVRVIEVTRDPEQSGILHEGLTSSVTYREVAFNPGDVSATLVVPTEDEDLNDGNSRIKAVLQLSDMYGVRLDRSYRNIWVGDNDIATVSFAEAHIEHVETPGGGPPFTLVRTGNTSHTLGAVLMGNWIAYYSPRFGNRVEDNFKLGHVIRAGEKEHTHSFGPELVGPRGGRTSLTLEPLYCEEVPGDCGYRSQYLVGEISRYTATLHDATQAVTVVADRESVNEGEPATFTLTRIGGAPDSRGLKLTVRVAATQDGEFIQGATPQTVTFAGYPDVSNEDAESTATVTIETVDDDVYEFDGSVTLTILPPEGRVVEEFYSIGEAGEDQSGSATVAVVNDDDPAVSIGDAEAPEAGGSMVFTVTAPANDEEMTVDWATSDGAGTGTATAGQDYTAATGTLRFLVGETSKTISIEILDDGIHEADETFTVTLSNPSEIVLGRAAATGVITNDDPETPPVVTVWTDHGSVEEGEPATFDFRRQPPGDEGSTPYGFGDSPLTLNLTLTETGDFIVEALENAAGVRVDYVPGSSAATVTIPANHLYLSVQFSTEDDAQIEANGSIKIELAEGPGYTIGDDDEATVNVRDNDLGISIADATANEGDANIAFRVSLSGTSEETVTVVVSTVDGRATSGETATATSLGKDFEAKSETLTFAPSETEKTFTVTLVDDTFDEDEESFAVELSRQSDNAGLSDSSATAVISDNDNSMVVGVYREGKTVNEDAGGPVIFRFELTPQGGSNTTAAELTTEVHWALIEGTATAGEDYVPVESTVKTQLLPGVLSKAVGVIVLDDEVYEKEFETFTFDLKSALNLDLDPDHQSIVVSLRDNETLQAGAAPDSENVAEGDVASFTVTLTPFENAVPVEIEYEVAGTAGPADYTAPSGTLTIPAGESSARITIDILADTLHDPDETIGVLLANATGGGREIILNTTDTPPMITILDSSILSASIASGASADEGGAIEFTINLTTGTDRPVLIEWSTSDAQGDGAAESGGVDYTDASGTVTIAAGDTSGTFTVSTVEDSLVEGDETFIVVLSSAEKGEDPQTSTPVDLGISSATATIVDDDTAPTSITLTATPDRVDEDAGETDLSVTATLDGSTRLASDVTVDLGLEGSIATGQGSSEPDSVTLTIPAGQASGTATVPMTPANDEIAGGDGMVSIVGTATGFDITGATVTIDDDDEAPTGVILTLSHSSLSEGAVATDLTVTATLTGGDRRPEATEIPLSVAGVSIPATEENGEPTTAAANDDYTAASATLTIAEGEATGTATLKFAPTADNLVEGDETVQVSGTSPGLVVTPALLTIEDDDREPDGIQLSATPDGVSEDDENVQIQVTATLVGGGVRTEDTAVTLSVHDASAAAGADYTAGSGLVLVIPAGQVSGTASLSITLVDDDIYEDTETLAIRGSNEDPGLSVRGVRISIADDEERPTEILLVLDRDTVAEDGGSQPLEVTAIVQGDSKRDIPTQVSLSFAAPTTDSSAEGKTTKSTTISSKSEPPAGHSASARDFSAFVSTLTIPAGGSEGETVVVLSPIDDSIDEEDESLEVRGSTPDLKVSAALVTITDDDVAGVTITPTDLAITEGDSGAYSVVLDTQPIGDVTIEVAVPKGSDVAVESAMLTFTPSNWDTAQTVTVTANQDDDGADEDETTLSHTVGGADYEDVTADGVTVSVADDDRGIVFNPTSLTVEEGDADGETYTVKLATEPSEEVTVTVSGQAGTDLSLTGLSAASTLTFTTSNWNAAQTVTVKAAQDGDDGDDEVTLTHTAAGGNYAEVSSDLAVTLTDDDTLGVVVDPTAITVQAGGSNSYTVVLGTLPSGDVTVTVSGEDGTDLTLNGLSAANTLIFTTANWDTPQTVSVEAADDATTAEITLSQEVSSAADSAYDTVIASDVEVTLLAPGDKIQIQLGVDTSAQTLTVSEGDSRTYQVVLSHRPSGDVSVVVNDPTDNSDVTASPDSLTFTADNWNIAQTVTVSAAHDDDGSDESATVTHSVSGGGYDGVSAPDIEVTVTDDDRGIVFNPTSLTVPEGDATGATYAVKLATQPSEEVTVTVSGQGGTDLSLAGLSATGTLTFTTSNWDTAQTVTVKAGEDDDGSDDSVTLTHTAAGGNYAGASADLKVTVTDDDRGIVFNPTSLSVEEGDTTGATYTVKLATQPSEEVTVTVSGQAGTDLTLTGLSANTLTFTTSNWNTAQTVTVKAAEDDDGTDDSVTLTHAAVGGNYAGASADLKVTVTDDDRGIVFDPTSLSVEEGDADGETYTVKLATQPSEEVTVTVSGQAGTDLSLTGLSANTLTFTTSNWDTAQTVTVKAGEDDDGSDDTVTLTHAAAGGNYAGASGDLKVTVADDDRGIVFNPTSLTVEEGDATGETYTVKLATQPSEEVTVTVSGQGGTDLSLTGLSAASTLTFTTSDWDTAQTVTVKAGEDDDGSDDSVTLAHAAAGGNYAGASGDLKVTVADDDRGIVFDPTSLSVEEGDADGETYTVKLATQPSEEVTVTVSGQAGTDLSLTGLSANTLTFTTSNWDTAQTVTVKAGEDDDGSDDSVTLTHTAAGGNYAGASADLKVTVADDDRGIVFNPTSLTVPEGDTTGATYTVKLTTEPSAEVTVTVSGQAGTDLMLSGLSANTLTFTTANWNTAQTVTVKAGEDDDGSDDSVTLAHAAAGGNYAGASGDLKVTVADNDRGIVFDPTSLTVPEGDTTGATYTVKLATEPSEEVTVTVSGHNGTDVTLNKTTLTFTTSNWDTAQTVTVKAGEDADGSDDTVTLAHAAVGGNYAGASADLKVTVTDDDRGIVFDPTSLSVEEGDTTGATYTVKLATQPSEEVTVTVSGQAGTDLTLTGLSANTLTFTTSNWNTAQTVTVKAAEDDDGTDDSVTLTHAAVGGNYAGASADLKVTVTDDDRGIVFDPTSLSVEEGDADGETYTVKLATQPSEEVTVTVSGQAGTDLSLTGLSANTLTFTTSNWDTAQTVTVKAGEDDDGSDDSVTLTHTAAGGNYAGASGDLKVTVADDDRGIVFDPTSLSVEEGDADGETYTVKLATQPSEEVTVTVSGQAGTDLSLTGLSANTLTFTTSNWDTAQTVTVKAGEDDDGSDDSVTLTHTAAGGNYAGASADLKVTVADDDRGIVFNPTSLTVPEGDTTGATYTVKLTTQPSAEVTVTVSGQAGTDLTLTGLSANTLTFTTSNWDTAQTVTVKAGEDDDGSDDSVTLAHAAAGGNYAGASGDLKVTVTDDDRGIGFDPTSLSVEEGDADGETYTVKLTTQPSEEVTVTVSGHNGTDVTLNKTTLTFTTSNWDTAQTVTVKAGEDDDGSDDTVTLTHTAAGGDYAGASGDLKVTVDDDDRGIVFNPTSLTVTEGDADGETYTVKLATQPSEEVTVTVSGQAGTDLMLSGLTANTLTFTTSNWDTAQTVTVKAGEDDDGTDDKVTLTHTAAGGNYAGASGDLKVTVADDDRGIVFNPTSLTVEEGDTTGATYTVKLATQPSAEVTVTVSGQAGTDLSLTGLSSTNTLTFTTSNWDTAQTVTVKAAEDDDGTDDTVTLTHTAAGGDYAGASGDLEVTVADDDRGIVFNPTSLTVDEGDATGATYTVKLATEPSAEVTVTVSGQAGTDLMLSGLTANTLTFTTSNWGTAQTVTVKAGEDDDGTDDTVTLTHTAAGGDYAGASGDLEVTVTDDDRGIVLSPTSLTVDEGDTTGATYTVKLATQPSEDVTVTVSGHNGTDVTLNKTTLTFTTSNWGTAQTVTVKAAEDDDGTDDKVTLTHTAAGGNYAGASGDLKVTVDDDDRGIVFNPTSLTVTEGDADGETYTVKLATQPSEEVTVTVSGQAGTDLMLSGLSSTNTLTFTTSNWDTAQTVTVKAAEDDDGTDDTVTLTHTAAGGNYAGASGDLKVTVADDDRGIVFNPTSLTVEEGDTTGATYTVKLATQPSAEVTVTVSGQAGTDLSLTGLSSTNTLTFTTSNWDTAQTVTVKAAEDDDGTDDTVTLTHTAAGGDYAGASGDLEVTVADDDRGIVFNPTSLTVDEGDATGATYTVKLATEPSAEVTVTVSGQAGTDLMLSGLTANTLTFTTSNWGTAQTVTVKAGEDDDGTDDTVTLTHTAAGGDYAGASGDLEVTVTDDDRGIVLSPTSLTVDEGDTTGATYTVKLATQPSEDVTVTVSGHNGTDVTLNKTTLTFTTSNWGTAQTVTVKAAEDDDGTDDKVTLTHTAAGGNYAGASGDLKVTVDDDDRGIVFNPTSLTVTEGDADGETYTVKLATQPSAEVTVTVSGQAGTNLTLSGLSSTNTLTFTTSNWDTAQTVTVKAAEDDDGTDDTVTLTHTAAGGNYAGASGDLKVTVADDDKTPLLSAVHVSFANSAQAIPEGGTATVVVSLSDTLAKTVTIPLTKTNQAGAVDADYSSVPASLTFSAGDTEQSFTVSATVDSEDEEDEEVVLGFGTLPEGVGQGTVNQTTITILDVPSVSFGASDYSATEGGEDAVVTVLLSEPLPADVTVPLTAEGGGGATPDDWSGVPTQVTFSADETSKTFTLVAVDDTVEDDGEMVNLGFGTLPAGLNAGSPATATVTLMNVEESMNSCDENDVWCATIYLEAWDTHPPYDVYHNADWRNGNTGWYEVDRQFTYGGITYEVRGVGFLPDPMPNAAYNSTFSLWFNHYRMNPRLYSPPSEDHVAQWRLHVGDGIQLHFGDATRVGDSHYIWHGAKFRPLSRGGTTLDLRIERIVGQDDIHHYTPVTPNSRPTGELVVTGAPRAGNTLTMDASGISDPDGMVDSDIQYFWWVQYPQYSSEVAKGATYVVQPKYEGKPIYAQITFTDDAGRREHVNSARTERVCVEGGEIEPCQTQEPEDVGNAPVENTAATGLPAISGTPAVGETLTADTSDIEDVNGLTNAGFAFQWSRYDGTTPTDITGATSSTYTVQNDDIGNQLLVTVSFTDDDGNQESLTSSSVYIQSPQPLYGGFDESTVPDHHDGSNAFTFQIHFSEEPELNDVNVRDYVLTVTGGQVISASPTDPDSETPHMRWTITVRPSGNTDVTVLLPPTTDCEDQGAVCTSLGKMLINRTAITVPGPDQQQQKDDDGGIVFNPTSLTVPEGDTTGATYTVKLATEPSEDVTVTVSGQAGTDLSLTGLSAANTLTFTTSDWDTAQTVTVTGGQDDDGTDDAVTLTHTATGGNYEGVSSDLTVTVTDDDGGIVFNPISLTVEEGDTTGATYTVKLATEPSEEVTVTVSGQAGTDLSLTGLSAANTLTFTTSNWDTAQTVTVTGGQDDDGSDDSVTLTHTAAGGNYEGVSSDLTVTVTDDDRGIMFNPTSLTVQEGDTTGATYTVKLATQPSEEVTVTVSGQAGTDLSLTGLSAANTLTFTTSNWDTAQTVTVTGGQDDDGSDDSVTLTHTAAGGNYEGVSSDLTVTVTDDDRRIMFNPTSLTVQEGDTTGATYTVKLATQPSEEVTVTVSGQAGTDLSLTGLSAASTLTFTTSNWDTAQTVTVTGGQDDDGSDDTVTLTHTAAGGNYEGVSSDLTVTVTDDDRGIMFNPASLTVEEGDADGETYTVKLATEPSEEVTVTVSGHDASDLTLSGLSSTNTLTFTTSNWDTAQTVTVTGGQDDDGSDDSVTLTHTAVGGKYAGASGDLKVTVTDDDGGIVFNPTSLTVEEGDADGETYTVKLAAEPSEEVTVTVSGQAGTDLSLTGLSAASTLTFTTSNWDTAQTVTVTGGQDDDGSDDSVTLTHTAAGGNYEGVSSDLSVTVTDTVTDDDRGIVFNPTSLTVEEGDTTGATYTVKLATEPSEEVTVTVSGHDASDLTLSGLSSTNTLTFTTSNWDTAQTVTVTAGQDDDGSDDSVTLTHTAAGGDYAGASGDLKVTVADDDRGIVFNPTSLTVEEGDADGETYTVKLATEPSEEVTVTVSGHNGTDVTLNKTTLTFTTSNWDTAQTVTVKAGEDDDGSDDTVTLTHAAAGGNYEGVSSDLAVTVADDEKALSTSAQVNFTTNAHASPTPSPSWSTTTINPCPPSTSNSHRCKKG